MEDTSLIARQLQRETEAAEEARKRFKERHKKACDNSYASSNVDARKAISVFTQPIAEHITKRYGFLMRSSGALDAAAVVNHLKGYDPQILALITMKTILDVFGKESEPQLQALTTAIGKNVQLEIRLSYYAQENPELYKKTEKFFHPSKGTAQRATILKMKFAKAGFEWENWSQPVNHKVGNFLLMSMNAVTGWIKRATDRPGGGRKTRSRISYTDEFLQHRDTILAAAESLAFCQWPMLCPPIDWTNEMNGGYLSEQIRQVNPLVRKTNGLLEGLKQGEIPLAMLNNLQKQAYKVNREILEVAEHFYEKSWTVGKFVRQPYLTVEGLDDENPSEERLQAYKVARREAEDHNAQIGQKNWRTSEVMFVARKYSRTIAQARLLGGETFWMPASFDYRGRVYFLNTALNPQGTDFDKSLLYFDEESAPNRFWIAFHLSTTWGNDKATIKERINWVRDNKDLIIRVASDPIGNNEWHDADEPWCFLAACIEYYQIFIEKSKKTSGLPIGIDATCSGLQHLAAMTLCGDTAKLVNVVPTPKPADAYLTVANAAAPYVPAKYKGWLNRKVTKRSVMTTPYGVTMSSARGYIRDQLIKDGHKEEMKEAGVLKDFVQAIFCKAIPEVLPGPIQVMAWLKRSAGEILKTKDEITWETPSGFVVNQRLYKPKMERIQTRIMGGARIDVSVGNGWTDEPDTAHHRSALAPNVVHSLDASLLHLTFQSWELPFTVIHDCIMGRSSDMHAMSREIRKHFAFMYSEPVMANWAKQVGVEIPDGLIQDTLDLTQVQHSQYFFS